MLSYQSIVIDMDRYMYNILRIAECELPPPARVAVTQADFAVYISLFPSSFQYIWGISVLLYVVYMLVSSLPAFLWSTLTIF